MLLRRTKDLSQILFHQQLLKQSFPLFGHQGRFFFSETQSNRKNPDIQVFESQTVKNLNEDDSPTTSYSTNPYEDDTLIDVENFQTWEYIKYLINPRNKLEDKDFFPYWMLIFYSLFFIHLLYRKIWPRKIIQDERAKTEAKNMLGLGERQHNQFNFEAFEAQRDRLIRKI